MDDVYEGNKREWRRYYEFAENLLNVFLVLGILTLALGVRFAYTSQDKNVYPGSVTVPVSINYPAGFFKPTGNQNISARIKRVEIDFGKGTEQSRLYQLRGAAIYLYFSLVFLVALIASLLYSKSLTTPTSYVMKLVSVLLYAGCLLGLVDALVVMPYILKGIQFGEFTLRLDKIGDGWNYLYLIPLIGASSIWNASKKVAQMDLPIRGREHS